MRRYGWMIALAPALMLVLPAPAMAQSLPGAEDTRAPGIFKSGEEVYEACTSQSSRERAMCDWFLMGAHDMAALFRDTDQIAPDTFCTPAGIEAEELREAVVARWEENPDSRKYSAVSAALNAFVQTWPGICQPIAARTPAPSQPPPEPQPQSETPPQPQ